MTLLDVNVLIALAWANHQHHEAAHRWFSSERTAAWATCPMTQVAFVRISANPRIVDATVSPAVAVRVLREMTQHPDHRFWGGIPDIAALRDWPPEWAQGHRQVVDAYLVATADRYHGKLATFDRGLAIAAGGGKVQLLKT